MPSQASAHCGIRMLRVGREAFFQAEGSSLKVLQKKGEELSGLDSGLWGQGLGVPSPHWAFWEKIHPGWPCTSCTVVPENPRKKRRVNHVCVDLENLEKGHHKVRIDLT